jgi:Mycothiol maleylpyruvate isomerase N-terminal domain
VTAQQPASASGALPAGLRERVLATSRQARPAGLPWPEPAEVSAAEAFCRAADALDWLLGTVDDDDWWAPALRDLNVQGLVGHLTGVEEDVDRCLAGDPGVSDVDHVEATQPSAARQVGRPPDQTRAEWRRAVDRTLGLVRALARPAFPAGLTLHGMCLSLDDLLVVRAFELWTHENDIRLAVARLPLAVPDPACLRLMTDLAARALPLGAVRAGLDVPVRLHLVLTGPGGGTWDVTLGDGDGCPDPVPVRIVTGTVGFCRLVANRVRPGDLDVDIGGDPSQAAGVLAAAAALALD